MKPWQEVNRLRKDGQLDDAYAMAQGIVGTAATTKFEIGAYGWCLIALVKRHAEDQDKSQFQKYLSELIALRVPDGDEMLAEHRERALALADESRRDIEKAKRLGKDGQHEQAVRAFEPLLAMGVLNDFDKRSFGWDLFRTIQAIMKAAKGEDLTPFAVQSVRRHLHTYIKLGLKGPDLLHSCILQQAARLAHSDKLNLISFIRMWDLESFRPEDYKGHQADDGKVYPSLVETVVQQASKEAAKGGRVDDMRFILPHAESAMKRFPDNIWLKLSMAKLLRGLNRLNEARRLAVEFASSKAGEYWTWDLLGDLEPEGAMRLSCYAKALSCSEDDAFVSKVRLKLAALLAADYPGHARTEVERVIESKRQRGENIPSKAQDLAHCGWFTSAVSAPTGKPFYDRFKAQAEDILFAHLPWIDASFGEDFVVPGRDGQKDRKLRRIYMKATPLPVEISVPSSRAEVRGKAEGTPVRIRIDTPADEPWRTTVHSIQMRADGEPHDIVPEVCGVIDHVNLEKSLVHFVVARGIDGTFPISQFQGAAEPGAAIAVRMASYRSRNGTWSRVISAAPSDQKPADNVFQEFRDIVEVSNSGFGFTMTGIFIPPNLVASANISYGDEVQGMAVINYDKKKDAWGWKAISTHRT